MDRRRREQPTRIENVTGSSDHACPECDAVFVYSQSLRIHLQSNHTDHLDLPVQADLAIQADLADQSDLKIKADLADQADLADLKIKADLADQADLADLKIKADLADPADLKIEADLADHVDYADQAVRAVSIKFKCVECDELFVSRTSRREHLRKEHFYDEWGKRWLLSRSLRREQDSEELVKEEDIEVVEHGKGEKPVLSRAQRYENRKQLRLQLIEQKQEQRFLATKLIFAEPQVDSSNQQYFRCRVCGKRFSKKILVQVHVIRLHTTVKPYGCKQCGARFAYLNELNRHITWKHSKRSGGLKVCDACGMRCVSQRNLDKHFKSTRTKCFIDRSKKLLKDHEEKAHFSQTFPENVKCRVFPRAHTSEKLRLNHVKKRHISGRASPIQNNGSALVCGKCERTFQSSDELRNHFLSHVLAEIA